MSGSDLYRALARLADNLLAPGFCYGCGVEIELHRRLCDTCRARLEYVPNPCAACAQPNPVAGQLCPRCLLHPPRWQKMVAPFRYRGLTRDYILELKFNQARYLGKLLCVEGLARLRAQSIQPEVLLPVPLHPNRLFERGYNQAEEIARFWSLSLGVPRDRRVLSRRRDTASQSGLSAAQRVGNLRGAFAYDAGRAYRHVAIVDDVVTTGSTIDEITRVLHRGGVEFVEVWALARAYRD